MSKRTIYEDQIVDVIWGATLLGGGGGGSMANGLDLLNKYKNDHPEKPVEVSIYGCEDMKDGCYAAVTAGMGAPTAIKDVDFSEYAINAFVTLQEMAAKMDVPKKLEYSMAVELGGFNTFVPMLISLVNNIPFIDADGAGRAVPALDTLLLHVNGCDTAPLAMADGKNNKVKIELENPRNAKFAEDIGRNICIAFGMLSGLSGWMINSDDIKKKLPEGSVSLSEKVGNAMRKCADDKKDVFEYLSKNKIADCRPLGKGKVIKAENIMEKGFDYGKVYVSGESELIIYFQNENLLVSKDGVNIMTVPDIICTYDVSTGKPLTNADIKEGMEIAVGAIKVDKKWWNNQDMFGVWKPFLEKVGYRGENIPY